MDKRHADGGNSSSELSEGESVGMGECGSECGHVFRPRKPAVYKQMCISF